MKTASNCTREVQVGYWEECLNGRYCPALVQVESHPWIDFTGVALEDMVSGGLGSVGEQLHSMVSKGFSKLDASVKFQLSFSTLVSGSFNDLGGGTFGVRAGPPSRGCREPLVGTASPEG